MDVCSNRDLQFKRLEARNRELEARIAELSARLEIDPSHGWDGIACRDETIRLQDDRIAELQAKIDALMLEYCPEEMTQKQMDNWERHQRRTPD